MYNYAPLISPAVSPFLPERINVVSAGDEIAVSELYLRGGIPHIALTHLLWDMRIHFKIRWVSRQNTRIIALLEVIEGTFGRPEHPAQVFVYVPSKRRVSLVPNAEFTRALQVVCSDIMSRQHYNSTIARQRFMDDIKFAFGRIVEPPAVKKESTYTQLLTDFMQAIRAT